LEDEQIIKVLYTPVINNLVDKNIKSYSLPEKLPNKYVRNAAIYNSYTLEQKFISIENKSILSFFKFLFRKINE